MAKAKTKLVGGERVDINTGLPFTSGNTNITLTGADLTNPQPEVTLPDQPVSTSPAEFVNQSVRGTVQSGNDAIVKADTAEAKTRDDLLANLVSFDSSTPSFNNYFESNLDQFGTPDAVKELKDVQLQLNNLNEGFDITNTRIEGGEGQNINQSLREVTQNEKERAVRTASLAARAQILQGNIQTAQSLARDAVTFAFQDRTLKLQTLNNQLTAVSGIVEGQEKQLIDARKRLLDKEEKKLERVQNAVESAIISGGATTDEMTAMLSDSTPDSQKLAIANSIRSRVAGSDRALDRAYKQSQIDSVYETIRQKKEDAAQTEQEAKDLKKSETEAALANLQIIGEIMQFDENGEVISTADGFSGAVGAGIGKSIRAFIPFVDTDGAVQGTAKADFYRKHEQLVNSLTIENLDLMSGVLSESDIKILSGAATTLSTAQSEAEYIKEVKKIYDTFNRAIKENGITSEQASFYYGIEDDAIYEVDAVYGDLDQYEFNAGDYFNQ